MSSQHDAESKASHELQPASSPELTLRAYTHAQVFKRLGIRATFYTDEEMLAPFPLRATPRLSFQELNAIRRTVPANATCPLCLKTSAEVDMARTQCCQQVRDMTRTLHAVLQDAL